MAFLRKWTQVYRPVEVPNQEPNPLPLVGVALVIYGLIQFVGILIPFDLGNPEWELTVIGQLVDNALTPLLGMALFFFGRTVELPYWRLIGTRLLGWLSLLLALLYLAILPLAVNDTLRVSRELNNKMHNATQVSEREQTKVREALDSASTMQELDILVTVLNMTPSMAQRREQMPEDSFAERREWLWETIRFNQRIMLDEAFKLFRQDKARLMKDAIRIGIGSVLMILLYGYFFYAFRSARGKHR
ncbi:MAG: HpsJ family protein, partial [Verrucomicrobiota bacterium]